MLFNWCVGLVDELLWVCLNVVLVCVYCCLGCGVSLLAVVVCLFYFCLVLGRRFVLYFDLSVGFAVVSCLLYLIYLMC